MNELPAKYIVILYRGELFKHDLTVSHSFGPFDGYGAAYRWYHDISIKKPAHNEHDIVMLENPPEVAVPNE